MKIRKKNPQKCKFKKNWKEEVKTDLDNKCVKGIHWKLKEQ